MIEEIIRKPYLAVFFIYLVVNGTIPHGRRTLSKLLFISEYQARYAIHFWEGIGIIETRKISEYQSEIIYKEPPTLTTHPLFKLFSNIKQDIKTEENITTHPNHPLIDLAKEKAKTIRKVFEYWNEHGFKKHRVLSERIRGAINAKLINYKEEEIIKAIQNYFDIVNDKKYIWSYKDWTLDQFLQRAGGFNRFCDDANPYKTMPKDKTAIINDDVWKGIE